FNESPQVVMRVAHQPVGGGHPAPRGFRDTLSERDRENVTVRLVRRRRNTAWRVRTSAEGLPLSLYLSFTCLNYIGRLLPVWRHQTPGLDRAFASGLYLRPGVYFRSLEEFFGMLDGDDLTVGRPLQSDVAGALKGFQLGPCRALVKAQPLRNKTATHRL